MKPLDRHIITFHERLLQWIWDQSGVSRIWVMRIVGSAAVLGAYISALSQDSVSSFLYIFAIGIILAQGIDESLSSLYGKNNNLRIMQVREFGVFFVLRVLVTVMVLITLPEYILSGLYYKLAGDFGYLVFLYLLDSTEPTDPTKFLDRNLRYAQVSW